MHKWTPIPLGSLLLRCASEGCLSDTRWQLIAGDVTSVYCNNCAARIKDNLMNNPIQTTLDERGKRYGDYSRHAEITQALKTEMYRGPSATQLDSAQREALEMIMHKIGRIVNGDPDYADSWIDIAGYAQLVVNHLETKNKGFDSFPPPIIEPSSVKRKK